VEPDRKPIHPYWCAGGGAASLWSLSLLLALYQEGRETSFTLMTFCVVGHGIGFELGINL